LGHGPRLVLACLVAVAAGPLVRAEEPPPNYAAVFAGTTVAYRAPGESFGGWQRDLTALLGYGRFVSKTVALELDLGPTWVRGDYASFAFVPGVVWCFHPNAYAAARFIVPVDPETNLVLFPGVGLTYTFGRFSPILEVNLSRTVGRGRPDLGVAVTAGLLVAF
jgi:hypothetical protein